MTDYIMAEEMEEDIADFDAGGSTNSDNEKVDSILIRRILCEMKSEFNRAPINENTKEEVDSDGSCKVDDPSAPEEQNGHKESIKEEVKEEKESLSSEGEEEEDGKAEEEEEEEDDNEEEQSEEQSKTSKTPRLVLKLKTAEGESEVVPKRVGRPGRPPNSKKADSDPPYVPTAAELRRRVLKTAAPQQVENGPKRSSRRMSKDFSKESVLQNAILRKEESFSSLNRAQRKSYRRSGRVDPKKEDESKTVPTKRTRASKVNNPSDSETSSVNSSCKSSIGKVIKMVNEPDGEEIDIDVNEDNDDVGSESQLSAANSNTSSSVKTSGSKPSIKNEKNCSNQSWADDNSNTAILPHKDQTNSSRSSSLSSSSSKKKRRTQSLGRRLSIDKLSQPYNSSPVVVEGNEAPVVSEKQLQVVSLGQAKSGGLCECETPSDLYAGSSGFVHPSYCRAIDSFENKLIGCCNLVDENTPLLRPSRMIPHLLMCDVHIKRLLLHQICPTCGLFCTQGNFMLCENNHFFHKTCEVKREDECAVGCPHCGSDVSHEVKVGLGQHRYPVFLSNQKPPNKFPNARMTLNGELFSDDSADDLELSGLMPADILLLPNGRKITAEGIPSGEKEKLESLLHACNPEIDMQQRFSYRNMYQAAKNGETDKMIQMLGSGMNPNQMMRDGGAVCALHAAAAGGHLAIVHILVQAGANTEVLDKNQYTPLMLATLKKHNDIVKYLIKAGACVSFKGPDGMTALHLAAKSGNLDACKHLLTCATTPNTYVDVVDDGRWTPLVWAAENCHVKIVRYLLEKKADPQIRDSEMNIALHWSAYAKSVDITMDLLDYGSNINLSNIHGDTPLHIAARQDSVECVILLLSRGARVDMLNKAGQLARDCCPDPANSECFRAIDLNMGLRKLISSNSIFPRILSNDISRGRETYPIQCVNAVDGEDLPKDFVYITENCLTTNISIDRRVTSLSHCKCEDTCLTSNCMCAKISLRSWYDSRGRLLPDFDFKDPPMIFECNQMCNCNIFMCKNRVVQQGIKVRLQVCKTKNKNWGVITLNAIPKGSYVCEYIGEIISDCEADTREDDSYLFDLDSRDGETYCIDARKYGNVTRFINHSCNPNILPVRVFVSHHDIHFPRIAFFAKRDIAANEELGFQSFRELENLVGDFITSERRCVKTIES